MFRPESAKMNALLKISVTNSPASANNATLVARVAKDLKHMTALLALPDYFSLTRTECARRTVKLVLSRQ